MSTFTASDLRSMLMLMHQPHYVPTDETVLQSAVYLHGHGVTVRRVQNAAAAIGVSDTGVIDTLVQFLHCLSLPVVGPILIAANDDYVDAQCEAATADALAQHAFDNYPHTIHDHA